eukprot:11177598-Alexandrium_andersonii.AAC.1
MCIRDSPCARPTMCLPVRVRSASCSAVFRMPASVLEWPSVLDWLSMREPMLQTSGPQLSSC